MRRVADDRMGVAGVLERRPRLDRRSIARSSHVNAVDQYRALINLVDRGLLSTEEFERQGMRISRR